MLGGVGGAVIGALATLVAARYGWLSTKYQTNARRIEKVEKAERRCQRQLFKLRTDFNTIYLINCYLYHKIPDADLEVGRMLERLRSFRAIHTTESGGDDSTK